MTEESLFAAVVEQPPADRLRFLQEACGNDAELLKRLRLMLAVHEKAAKIVDQREKTEVRARPTAVAIHAEGIGTIIAGRFKLLEPIGEGGMGTVWVAEQTEPVRRKVALKLIKAGMDTKAVLTRFQAERQALALMDHPNIAKVLDGGTTETGRPFFIMEYVKGVPFTKYCDNARLNIAERLNLFVPVCQAVQHAHQKGIIHRDLKPSNILVCLYDGRPVPKVIDFGLAKAMHQPLTEHTLHTAHGQLMGTPLYMSPEQAEINNLDVDTRSDIYSLGVILYELLTGTTPLEQKRFREAAWQEMMRLIKEEDPPRPSDRLSSSDTLPSLAAQRKLEPVKLTRLVRGELDWIVMKALDKERSRRYESANGFARDIQAYLANEPVQACPPSTAYRLRKFVGKHRVGLTMVATVTVLLLAGAAVSTWQAIRATRAELEARVAAEQAAQDRQNAKNNERAAREQELEAKKQSKIAAENERKALTSTKEKESIVEDLRHNLSLDKILLARAAFESGNVILARERLDEVPPDLRRWEWNLLDRQYEGGIFTLYGHTAGVLSVASSPDGTRIASGSEDKTVKVWDGRTGALLHDLKGYPAGVFNVAFSPDGTRLLTCSLEKPLVPEDIDRIDIAVPLRDTPTGMIAKVWDVAHWRTPAQFQREIFRALFGIQPGRHSVRRRR